MSQEYMLWNKFTVGESVYFYTFSIHIHKTLICQDLYQVWVCSLGDRAAACFSRKWHILVAIFFLLTFNKTSTSKTCTVDLLESYLIFLFIELASIGNEKQSQNCFLLPFPTNICALKKSIYYSCLLLFICYLYASSQVKCNLVLSRDIFPNQMGLLFP